MTAMYSLLHMLVDGVCALAMFGHFFIDENGHFSMLLYNFCAFALQMPLGTWLDLLVLQNTHKKEQLAFVFAVSGVLLTIVGAFLHPVVLGIGNALFHIGGGVGTIQEDTAKSWQGRGLGVFVAPGAFGLYIGTVIGKGSYRLTGMVVAVAVLLIVVVGTVLLLKTQKLSFSRKWHEKDAAEMRSGKGKTGQVLLLATCCFLVVVLRSYIGMAVAFPWKQVPVLGCISVLAVVAGKVAGGFIAAGFGYAKTAVITLFIASIGYIGLDWAPLGLVALFFFNMTMPMTLYLLIRTLKQLPGFSFGLLTFGLFLGFLPAYFAWELPWKGQVLGPIGCVVSMILLLIGIRMGGGRQHVSD